MLIVVSSSNLFNGFYPNMITRLRTRCRFTSAYRRMKIQVDLQETDI